MRLVHKRLVHHVTFDIRTGEILSKGYCQLRTMSAQLETLQLEDGEDFMIVPTGTNQVDHMIDLTDPSNPQVVRKPVNA